METVDAKHLSHDQPVPSSHECRKFDEMRRRSIQDEKALQRLAENLYQARHLIEHEHQRQAAHLRSGLHDVHTRTPSLRHHGKTALTGSKKATVVKVRPDDVSEEERRWQQHVKEESISAPGESHNIRATTRSYVRRAETIARVLTSLYERRSVHINNS